MAGVRRWFLCVSRPLKRNSKRENTCCLFAFSQPLFIKWWPATRTRTMSICLWGRGGREGERRILENHEGKRSLGFKFPGFPHYSHSRFSFAVCLICFIMFLLCFVFIFQADTIFLFNLIFENLILHIFHNYDNFSQFRDVPGCSNLRWDLT